MRKKMLPMMSFWVSLILFVTLSMTTVAADPVNLFVNPSFEELDANQFPVGWAKATDGVPQMFIDTEVYADGKQSVRLETDKSGMFGLFQKIEVQPGKSYEVRVSTMGEGNALDMTRVRVNAYDKDKKLIPITWDWIDDSSRLDYINFYEWSSPSFLLFTSGASKKAFTESWFRFTVPPGSGCVQMDFIFYLWGGRIGKAWIDNARLFQL